MSEQEILELAAILVDEHGHTALQVAQDRCAEHAQEPHSECYRLWSRIADATARLLGRRQRQHA